MKDQRMFEASATRSTPNAQCNRVVRTTTAKLLFAMCFGMLLAPTQAQTQSPSQAFPRECENEFEVMAVGELMLLVESCKVAFPELCADLDRTIAPVSKRFPACVAAYRKGAAYDRLMAMFELAGGPSVLKKNPHCTKDVSDVVPKLMLEAERIDKKSTARERHQK
jgi:hypothetical protein